MKPGHRWFIYWTLLIFLAPSALALTNSDDFEDDVVGNPPTATWYTYGEGSIGSGNQLVGDAATPGLAGTNQKIRFIERSSGTGGGAAWFDIDNAAYQLIQFEVATNKATNSRGLMSFCQTGTVLGTGEYCASNPVQLFFDQNGMKSSCHATQLISDTNEHSVSITIDYALEQYSISIDGTPVITGDAWCSGSGQTQIGFIGFLRDLSNTFPEVDIDELSLTDDVSALTPEAPAGVEGVTVDPVADEYTVAWRLSPDDPDSESGAYDYTLYADTGSGYTSVYNANAGDAISGVFTATVQVTNTGTILFKATATNSTSGFEGPDSCIITLDGETEGSRNACGEEITLVIDTGSGLTDDDGGLFGGDKNGLATALQISVPALEFSMGVMLMLLVTAGGYYAGRQMGAFAACFLGIVLGYTLGLMPFWSIYVGGFLLAAVAVLYVRSRGALNGN